MRTFINFELDDIQDLLDRSVRKYPEELPNTLIRKRMEQFDKGVIKDSPLASIVILTKDNLPFLRACTSSIERFTEDVDVEIIIISNCEEDATKEYLDKCSYKVYYRKKPFSFGSFNNFGADKANGKYLVFLNDDTVVTKKWLSNAIEIMEEDSEIGICGVKVLDTEHKLQHMGISINQPGDSFATHMFAGENPDIPQANEHRFVKAVSGVCMIMEKYTFELMNGFDSEFDQGYFEDLDLCLRLEKVTEKKVLYLADSIIYHFGSVTFNRDPSKNTIYHNSLHHFRNKWQEDTENTSVRFKSKNYVYKTLDRRVTIHNPYMYTAGGGEALTIGLANALKNKFGVTIRTSVLNDDVLRRLRYFLDADLHNIDFELINKKNVTSDIFINLEFGGYYAEESAKYNIYYNMFPTMCGNNNYFLSSYEKVLSISEYSAKYTWDYWRRYSGVIYPPVTQIGMQDVERKEPIILSVGRFFKSGHRKNQDVLLKAFKQIKDSGWKLILAGSYMDNAQDRDYIEELRKFININGLNVELCLNISKEELNSLYKRASIYWHATGMGARSPIECEHFGITVVEAMSAGVIPVVYDAGGPVETTKGICDEYRWTNLKQLCGNTQNLFGYYNTKNMEDLQQEVIERASDFSYDAFSKKWINTIEEIL